MAKFVALSLILLSVMTLAITGSVQYKGAAFVEAPTLDSRLYPGQHKPKTRHCIISISAGIEHSYCTLPSSILVYINSRKIYRVIVLVGHRYNITVGQLIVQWGQPTGAHYGKFGKMVSHTLYWPDRFVGVMPARRFSPTSRISFIGYGEPLQEAGAWCGFTTRESC